MYLKDWVEKENFTSFQFEQWEPNVRAESWTIVVVELNVMLCRIQNTWIWITHSLFGLGNASLLLIQQWYLSSKQTASANIMHAPIVSSTDNWTLGMGLLNNNNVNDAQILLTWIHSYYLMVWIEIFRSPSE